MKQSRRMLTLRKALMPNSSLRDHIVAGAGAVRPSDRGLIHPLVRRRIGDGVDLDAATVAEAPQAHRWDYILSIPSTSKLIGLEPHTASDGEVKVVIRKKQNAQVLLRSHFQPGFSVTEWHWVTRGTVGFSRMDRAMRALNQSGIRFAGRSLRDV